MIYQLTQPELFAEVLAKTQSNVDHGVTGLSVLDAIVERHSSDTILNALREAKDHNRAGKAIMGAILDAPGADLASARGTMWGFVNGVSWHCDHEGGKDDDARLTSAWFGTRSSLKQDAIQLAVATAQAAHA